MRPSEKLRHLPYVSQMRNSTKDGSLALLCYHGNSMHIRSLLPKIGELLKERPFKLRIVMSKIHIQEFIEDDSILKSGKNRERVK